MNQSVAQTSIDAYHKLIRSGELTAKCKQLAEVYYRYGAMADYHAAAYLGWDKSEVSARRNDMMLKDDDGRCTGKGKVIEYGTILNPKTNHEVNLYKLNLGEQPTLI